MDKNRERAFEDFYGPWPIKHKLYKTITPEMRAAKYGFVVAYKDQNGDFQYWTDTVEPIDATDCNGMRADQQDMYRVIFSPNSAEAAVFGAPKDSLEAFDRRAWPILRHDMRLFAVACGNNIRVLQYDLQRA